MKDGKEKWIVGTTERILRPAQGREMTDGRYHNFLHPPCPSLRSSFHMYTAGMIAAWDEGNDSLPSLITGAPFTRYTSDRQSLEP